MLKLITFGDKKCPSFNEYIRRIKWAIEVSTYPSNTSEKKISEIFEKAFAQKGYKIICDELGENYTSIEFANQISQKMQHYADIVFITGPFCGVPELYKKSADKIISFGKMTWPHELARIMLVEQIYRAQQILSGHPYHK